MKEKIIKLLLTLGTVGIMLAVFMFSSKTASESTVQSSRVSRLVCRIIFFGYRDMDISEQEFIALALDPFIRKLAHFGVFALMGMGAYAAGRVNGLRGLKSAAVPFVVCTLYAAFDEIHQSFVPGRAMGVKDICLDSAGVFCGIIVCGVLFILWEHFTRHSKGS